MKNIIEIDVPEGYDVKYDPDKKKIEMVLKNEKPKTWEELCNTDLFAQEMFYIENDSAIIKVNLKGGRNSETDKNLCNTYQDAEMFLAMMQLRQLRKAWVGDWEPDWGDDKLKYIVKMSPVFKDDVVVEATFNGKRLFSFPNMEMAVDFVNCYGELIKKALNF